MILFPYANNVAYQDGELSFGIQFMDKSNITEINIKIGLDNDLASMIEELLAKEEV